MTKHGRQESKDKPHCECGKVGEYNPSNDSYYCPDTGVWLSWDLWLNNQWVSRKKQSLIVKDHIGFKEVIFNGKYVGLIAEDNKKWSATLNLIPNKDSALYSFPSKELAIQSLTKDL